MAKDKKTENFDKGEVSKNTLNSMMNGYKDDVYNHISEKPVKISSGSLILNAMLGGGVSNCGTIRLAGSHSSGKSSQAFLLMSNFFSTIPNSKGIYVKAEARLSENLQTRTGLKFVFKADEWVAGTVFVLETNQFEVMADMIESLLKVMYQSGEKLCCIIDSLDGLILSADLKDKKITDGIKVAGVPSLLKLFNRRIGLPVNKYGALLILISQASSDIRINPYSKEPPRAVNGAGGASAAHCADVILEYNPRYSGDLILENPKERPSMENKVIAHECSITIKKSTNETDSMVCRIPIKRGRVGNSVWVERELVDMCLAFQVLKKEGAWFSFESSLIEEAKKDGVVIKEQLHGLNGAYSYIEEDKSVFNWMYNKFSKVLTF